MSQAANGSRPPYVKPADAAEVRAHHLRRHVISVRVTDEELAWVKRASKSARLKMGTYLRVSALGQHRAPISELNRAGLQLLGDATESILRIADSLDDMNAGKAAYGFDLMMLAEEMQRIRQLLSGALGHEATPISS